MAFHLSLVVHVLAAVVWVGGLVLMAFALPAPSGQDTDAQSGVWLVTLRRFSVGVHIAVIASWGTGIWMMFFFYDGFGKAGAHVDIMFLLGLIMTVLFVYDAVGPSRRFRRAVANNDQQEKINALNGFVRLARIGAVIGLLTIAVASYGPF